MKTRNIETTKSVAAKKTPIKKEPEKTPTKSEPEESKTTPKATQVKSPPSAGANAVKKIVKKATPKSAPKPEPKVEETTPASEPPQETGDSKAASSTKSIEKKIIRKKKSPAVAKAKPDDSRKKEASPMQVEKKEEQKPAISETEEKEKAEVNEEENIIDDEKEPGTINTVKREEENLAENPLGEDEYGAEKEDYGGEEKFEEPEDEEYAQDDLSEPEEVEEAEHMEEEEMQMSDLAKEMKLKKAQEVFVGGLDRDAVEDDVRKAFEKIGEVVEVRLHRNLQTNKNKGFAFVRFADQEQASRALSELKSPIIRGKQCGVAPSEDNDTLFLGNICNTWTKEAIKRKLKDYGVEGVENITLVADAQHEGLSRGFAFIEFSCHADAMLAYKRLQKPDVIFGHPERTVKVAFAEPLREPDPEIMAQVKSVFVDGLLSHWDEDRVREQFKRYGEIERVVLARNMATSKRKDFGFVDFTTHDAAIACIEGVNNSELGDGKTKVKVKARLSNPLPKTQAVKGGMRGGFRIRHPAFGFGRGFVQARRPLDRVGFERGRVFYPRGRGGQTGRSSLADSHDFGGRRPFRGRGGRRGSFGGRAYGEEFVTRGATSSRFNPDRSRPDAFDIGHAEPFQYERHPFPERDYGRPYGGRHFSDDSYVYDGAGSGLKRPFSMMDQDSGYLESGTRLRPRYDFPDPISHRTHYRDTTGTGGGLYSHDYYDSDYGGSSYSSLYEGEYSVGRRYYY